MTQIIETNSEIQKQFQISEHTYAVNTSDYDYCHKLSVHVHEKIEVNDYNNPEKECLTIQTWYCNDIPFLKATFNCEVDGPVQPNHVHILDAETCFKVIVTCGSLANLFSVQNIVK